MANVINHLPKKLWSEAPELLRQIPYAERRGAYERLLDAFVVRYHKAYPKAAETLCRGWEWMVAFYRFPKDRWLHLRTSNAVESPFSAVRLRTNAAKRYRLT